MAGAEQCRSIPWQSHAQRAGVAADEAFDARVASIGADYMRQVEKNFLLQMVDLQWREHLMHLDHLRNVIGLRGYGQRDPLNEYKTEAFTLFERLLYDLRHQVTRWIMTVEFTFSPPPPVNPLSMTAVHMDPEGGDNEVGGGPIPEGLSAEDRANMPHSALPAGWERTARNSACPCGSGAKFKHCHGALV